MVALILENTREAEKRCCRFRVLAGLRALQAFLAFPASAFLLFPFLRFRSSLPFALFFMLSRFCFDAEFSHLLRFHMRACVLVCVCVLLVS